MFDPRSAIKTILDGKVKVDDNNELEQNIPVYYSEEAYMNHPLPLIVLELAYSPSRVAHIGGGRYHEEATVDCHIYIAKTSNITPQTFKCAISDKVTSLIRTSEKIVSGCDFVQVTMTRDLDELREKNVWHRVLEIHAFKTKT